jgi:hypothetical protein
MGKLCKKLIVYLDQNFLSEMAKARDNERVKPEFASIYELLHQAFLDEKIVVPRSHFHDIETSLIPCLRERIRSFQGYLGQIQLQDMYSVQSFEVKHALGQFKGVDPTIFGSRILFSEDPDMRIQRFTFRGNIDWSQFYQQSTRRVTASKLNALREKLSIESISATTQAKRELEAQERFILSVHKDILQAELGESQGAVTQFVASGLIRTMPSVFIYAHMWAKLLVDFSSRQVKPSDETDVEIISTYLPYVDVLATDTFMANLIRNLHFDVKYRTVVFGASTEELSTFERWVNKELPALEPVNKPDLALFVLSDKTIKSDSWEFFRCLGSVARSHEARRDGWVEVFAFDDGSMPKYYDDRIKQNWPFYGLQDVSTIMLPKNASPDDIVQLCRDHLRAPAFVLIDRHQELPADFIQVALRQLQEGQNTICGYHIYKHN